MLSSLLCFPEKVLAGEKNGTKGLEHSAGVPGQAHRLL